MNFFKKGILVLTSQPESGHPLEGWLLRTQGPALPDGRIPTGKRSPAKAGDLSLGKVQPTLRDLRERQLGDTGIRAEEGWLHAVIHKQHLRPLGFCAGLLGPADSEKSDLIAAVVKDVPEAPPNPPWLAIYQELHLEKEGLCFE